MAANDTVSRRIRVRDPLVILAEGADAGVVAEGSRIAEVLPAGSPPARRRRLGLQRQLEPEMEGVRHALTIHRLIYGAEAVTHRDALRWATEGSAACLGRDDVGRVMVAGRWRVIDGAPLGIETGRLREAPSRLARQLFGRYQSAMILSHRRLSPRLRGGGRPPDASMSQAPRLRGRAW